MSLRVDPSILGFKRPFNRAVCVTFSLYNPGTEVVAFKVKTTAPKRYCVRPNSGHVHPQESKEVSVALQPIGLEPPADAQCKDKFMVQSVILEQSELSTPVSQLWSTFDKDQRQILEQKIRCAYLPASHSSAPIVPESLVPTATNTATTRSWQYSHGQRCDPLPHVYVSAQSPSTREEATCVLREASSDALAHTKTRFSDRTTNPPHPSHEEDSEHGDKDPVYTKQGLSKLRKKLSQLEKDLMEARCLVGEAESGCGNSEKKPGRQQRRLGDAGQGASTAWVRGQVPSAASFSSRNPVQLLLTDPRCSTALVVVASLVSFLIGMLYF